MSQSFDPASVDLPRGHFLGGRFVAPAQAEALVLHRPSDGQAYAECPIAPPGLVDEAVAEAQAALQRSGWARSRPRERVKALSAFADLILAETPRLAQIESLGSTRPIAQALTIDLPMVAEQIRFFAEMADKEGGEAPPTAADHLGLILDEPYGVVGAITPWNFPAIMAAWKIGPALAAGNAVVLKPSELTPFSSLALAELACRAGLPAGIFNVVLGDGPGTGAALTGHRAIGKISFTGSTRAGQAIMTHVARQGVRPMTLELGGKSPQIVFADADIDLAADCVARNILGNAGQVCVAGSRLIVEAPLAEGLTQAIIARMQAAKPGLAWDSATTYSPIISRQQMARIDTIVAQARDQGARVLTGGAPMPGPGYFYQPSLLAPEDPASPALQSEIFGPVLTVQSFTSEDEALGLAAHDSYGLAAGVYTRDLSRALRMTRALAAGTVWVNRYGRSMDHILPTGGFGDSGLGKDLGRAAYRANRREKTVLIAL